MLVADVLFAIGALWQAVTGTVWGMIFGRSVVGIAVGGASLVVPLYGRNSIRGDQRTDMMRTGTFLSSRHPLSVGCSLP